MECRCHGGGGALEHGLADAADWCYGVWAGEKMA